MSHFAQIHKYLLYLSVLFACISGIHIFWLYVAHDAKVQPIVGGALSIGFVGSAPSLSPNEYGIDPNQDMLLKFLYRSLLRYNLETQELEGDLANCDIGTNLREIRCYLKKGSTWNDGSIITVADVIRTYSAIKTGKVNESLKLQLDGIEVRDEGDFITFRSKSADVLALDSLLYPIMKAEDINASLIGSGNTVTFRGNGPYIFKKREISPSGNHEIITLERSQGYGENEFYYDKIQARFFANSEELEASQDILSIILDQSLSLKQPSERFASFEFHGTQYFSAFLNSATLPVEIRSLLVQTLKKDFKLTGNYAKIENAFLSSSSQTGVTSNTGGILDFIETLNRSGYFTKKQLLNQIDDLVITPQKNTPQQIPLNKFIIAPSRERFFATGNSEFFISGTPPGATTEISINNYALKTFTKGKGVFHYRASRTIGTLNPGKNTFTIKFSASGALIGQEQITIYWSPDAGERENQYKAYLGSLQSVVKQQEQIKQNEKNEKAKLLAKFTALDDTRYYNKKGEVFIITISASDKAADFAESITKIIQKLGIETKIIMIDDEKFVDIVKKGEKNYDILLAGIDLGMIHYNLFPFFHSGQVKNGFNFSQVKNTELDEALEQTKSGLIKGSTLVDLQKKITILLEKEAIFYPIGSPKKVLYFDKSIKQLYQPKTIPMTSFLGSIFRNSYMQEGRIIYWNSKSFQGGIDWWKQAIAQLF